MKGFDVGRSGGVGDGDPGELENAVLAVADHRISIAPMTLGNALVIFLVPVIRKAILSTYYGWKEGRTEIPYSRNWRGEWVADLKLKRIKRAILTGVAALFVAGVVLGFQAMSPDGPYADIPPAPIN